MIARITLLAFCGLMALPASAEVYRAPEGCEAFLTVQMRSCGVSLFWRCDNRPDVTWELHAHGEGPFSLSVYDTEYQWLDTLIYVDGTRERLLLPAEDPASLSELLETGTDSYSFVVAERGLQISDDVRYSGYDRLTGETVVIDGVELLRTEFETRAVSETTDEEIYRSSGNQFVYAEEHIFFSGTDVFVQGDLVDEGDMTPVQFITPDEPAFGDIAPVFGCAEPTDTNFKVEAFQ